MVTPVLPQLPVLQGVPERCTLVVFQLNYLEIKTAVVIVSFSATVGVINRLSHN